MKLEDITGNPWEEVPDLWAGVREKNGQTPGGGPDLGPGMLERDGQQRVAWIKKGITKPQGGME